MPSESNTLHQGPQQGKGIRLLLSVPAQVLCAESGREEEGEKALWGHLAGGSSLRGSQGTLRMMPRGKLTWGGRRTTVSPLTSPFVKHVGYRDPCDGGGRLRISPLGPDPWGAGKTGGSWEPGLKQPCASEPEVEKH